MYKVIQCMIDIYESKIRILKIIQQRYNAEKESIMEDSKKVYIEHNKDIVG